MLEFLKGKIESLDLLTLVTGLLGTIIFNLLLRAFYIKFGRAKTNRKSLADNFVMLGVSVTLIIFLIKSSIALSLGLVGALSIVRFRAAIKEPEELVFLFFSIALGLGFGAGQKEATILAFIIVVPFYFIKYKLIDKASMEKNLFLHFRTEKKTEEKDITSKILNTLKEYSLGAKIKRLDESNNSIDATFLIELKDLNNLTKLKDKLLEISSNSEVSFIDNVTPIV